MSCGDNTTTPENKNIEVASNKTLPSIEDSIISNENSSRKTLASSTFAEISAIRNNTHVMSWAYYQDPQNSRWYISYIEEGGKQDVYSLMSILNGKAGWATVGKEAATINLANQTVTIDYNLDRYPSDVYYDAGWNGFASDPLIHSDRQRIQGSTVPIKWYFFYIPDTGRWYIQIAPGFNPSGSQIKKFSSKYGEYDWIETDTVDITPFLYIKDNVRNLIFIEKRISSFITNQHGVAYDRDGYYGAQCVDLMHIYIRDVLDIPYPNNITGNAYPIFNNISNYITRNSNTFGGVRFDKIIRTSTNFPHTGDIVFWNPLGSNGYAGHVAICIWGGGDSSGFTSIDQNWVNSNPTTGSAASIQTHDYIGVAGWLRPIPF